MKNAGIQKLLKVFLITVLSLPVFGNTDIHNNLQVNCNQTQNNLLNCNYRFIDPEPVLSISSKFNNKSVPIKEESHYPWKDAITAILFLVDTSDPARANAIEQNKKHIRQILDKTKSYQLTGLASFDKTLRLEVPVGSSNNQILDSLKDLRATGQTTELYRSVLSAIELLEQVKADRKSIYLFSDGLAEDTAYFHKDVVSAARKAGVIITSIGYPRSISQSVALQTLRRLSEETGGLYIEADNTFTVQPQFLDNPFNSVDNGGKFVIDLSPLLLLSGKSYNLDLLFDTDSNDYNKKITVAGTRQEIKPSTTDITSPATPEKQSASAPKIRYVTKETPQQKNNLWFWYGIPAFLIILLVFTIFILIYSSTRLTRKQATDSTSFSDFKPYAYLVVQDETKKCYSITRTTWRIGRGKDNEMTLNDNSVSRRHAEIHRDKGDKFTIYDLDSLNGVYVNNEKVSKHILHEGDIIEVGDINFRFTLLSTEYALEEVTEMQNTRAPLTH